MDNHSQVQHIPSVKDSSTGTRHSPEILGNLVQSKAQGMTVKKKHSEKYTKNMEAAKRQIKQAEDEMKKIDQEVKEFHTHMSNSMAKLMKTFNDGF